MVRRENERNVGRAENAPLQLILVLSGLFFLLPAVSAFGLLTPQDVVILVNTNSPTSRYVAKLYRQYYPAISASQVLNLSGLTDCSGPASTPDSEIISRQDYENFIAIPLRAYLTDQNFPNRITTVKVIITTAGMPYRIKDTNPAYANAVYANGSNPVTISDHESDIDAASVESELTCLWQSNSGASPSGFKNRMVNPYQGYRGSGVELFGRQPPGTKNFAWTVARSWVPSVAGPIIEGTRNGDGAKNRKFNAGDFYLVSRLDGPKKRGSSAIFAVRAMLERAKRASDPTRGVNVAQAAAIFDDAPLAAGDIDYNRVFNLSGTANFWIYSDGTNQPPDATVAKVSNDYCSGFSQATGGTPVDGILNIGRMSTAYGLPVMLDLRQRTCTRQSDLDNFAAGDPLRINKKQGIVFLATFGVNGDEGNNYNYLATTAGFNIVNGAVFTSLESFNAVTMFSDVNTAVATQGKLVDFISAGGACAIGHSFEPQTDAAIDNEFLLYNLLADGNGDGFADMTFAESAFTAIPYLSWGEVVIGDPLMRIAYGPGEMAWHPFPGDINNDGRVNAYDVYLVRRADGGILNTTDTVLFDQYNDLCDINQDGRVNAYDVYLVRRNDGAIAGQ